MSEYSYVEHTIEPIYDEHSRILILGTLPSVKSREIVGSSDSTIQDVVVNDFTKIFETAKIERIYANGGKAYELYQKYAFDQTEREIIKLTSTSPANAGYRIERLCEEWLQIINT